MTAGVWAAMQWIAAMQGLNMLGLALVRPSRATILNQAQSLVFLQKKAAIGAAAEVCGIAADKKRC